MIWWPFLLIGSLFIVANWDEIVDWLRKFLTDMRDFVRQCMRTIKHVATVIGERLADGWDYVKHIMYYQEEQDRGTDVFTEATTKRKVKRNKMPDHIRAKLSNQDEVIMDDYVTQELGLPL